jgi:hypothetical protein
VEVLGDEGDANKIALGALDKIKRSVSLDARRAGSLGSEVDSRGL